MTSWTKESENDHSLDRTRRPVPDVVVLMLAFLVLPLGGHLSADDWPGFLGPNRDGISAETGLVDSWSEAGPEVLWRIEVGAGYSGVAVVAGRLYSMEEAERSEDVIALDAKTGRELWRTSLGRSRRDTEGSGPRATPTVDGDSVFVFGASGALARLDRHSGEVLWKLDTREEMGAQIPQWGISASPIVDGDRLIVQLGARKRCFAAFDKETGELLWATGSAKPAYASPIVVTIAGIRQAVFFTAVELTGVAVDDGRILWSAPWRTDLDVNAATPVFVPLNGIVVSSGYDTGAALLQIVLEGDQFEVYQVWRSRFLRNHFNGSVRIGKHLYGFDEDILKCVDVVSGDVLWQGRAGAKGSLIYADGKLIVLNGNGQLKLLEESSEEMVELASARILHDRTWAPPALADGVLYVRGLTEMVAVRLAESVNPGPSGP